MDLLRLQPWGLRGLGVGIPPWLCQLACRLCSLEGKFAETHNSVLLLQARDGGRLVPQSPWLWLLAVGRRHQHTAGGAEATYCFMPLWTHP